MSNLRILAQILRRDTKLKDISLIYDELDNESIKIIADAFDSSMVTTLDVSANKIGDAGLEYLMEKLKKSHVTDLSIISNKITDGGLEIVSRAIDDGMRLEKLSIGGDKSMVISDLGARYLVKILTGSSLKSLRLIGSKLTHLGFSYFVEALGQNSSLEDLTLGISDLSRVDLDNFLTVLENGGGSSLIEITLLVRSNDLSLWDRINKILERNKHNARIKETSFFFGLLKSLKDDL